MKYICMKKYGIHEWSFGDKPLFFFMATSKLLTNITNDYTTKLSLKCTINQHIIINFIVNVSMQILLKSTFQLHIPVLISILNIMQSTYYKQPSKNLSYRCLISFSAFPHFKNDNSSSSSH
jgi:hypothetical protein